MVKRIAQFLPVLLEPVLITGDVMRRMKLDARQPLRHDGDTFLRQIRTDLVDPLELRREPIRPRQPGVRASPSSIDSIWRVPRCRRKHHFPGERCTYCWILSDEAVEQGRAGSWQTDDKDRCGDGLLLDRGRILPVPFKIEQVLEQARREVRGR